MIHPRILIDIISDEPFRPFRLHTASGRVFEVRHPEMIKVGKSTATVYQPADGQEDAPHRWQEVSLMLVESVERVDVVKTHGNGSSH
jgi:hypothetical protein